MKIWNVTDGTLIRAIEDAHDDTVHGVRFSPDGKQLASCGADKYVRTFDLGTGAMLRRFEAAQIEQCARVLEDWARVFFDTWDAKELASTS